MNGPRRAQTDEATADVLDGGRITSVGGIPMQIVAKVCIPDVRLFAGMRPHYTDTEVERTTTWVFHAGQPVHELVAPTGSVYALQSCPLLMDPNLEERRRWCRATGPRRSSSRPMCAAPSGGSPWRPGDFSDHDRRSAVMA
jgi:hypothetical protein